MPHLGPWEIALIIVLALLIFGPRRLPEMAKSLGLAIQEFKKTGKTVQEEVKSALQDEPEPAPRSTSTGSSSDAARKSV